MKTLSEVLTLSTEYLQKREISRQRRMAEELLAHVLALKRLELYMQFDRPMEERELAHLRELVARKGKGEPLEYILGEVSFHTCTLRITPGVLIPRPETEILVDRICKEIKRSEGVLWDLCCGSGCMGLALKKTFPLLHVALSDLSENALKVAKENAVLNGLQVEFLQGDLLLPFEGRKADFVVCNPPYIAEGEFEGLDGSVRAFEPRDALVGGATGLEFYERLAKELPRYMAPHAKVFFEVGTGQGERILSLFSEPYWKTKFFEKDWAGHDRFFFLEFE